MNNVTPSLLFQAILASLLIGCAGGFGIAYFTLDHPQYIGLYILYLAAAGAAAWRLAQAEKNQHG